MTDLVFQPKSELVRTLVERGHLHQATNLEGLDARAASGTIKAYVGYDATAPSLHVGNMATIMLLRRLQQAGHTPIVLMGGATTKVGDPTGRDSTRPMLTDELIAGNIATIRQAFARYLAFDGPNAAVMVNNADWIEPLGYLEFLRTYGPHFTINRMLTFDSVRLRLEREQPMTFLEFNYMLVQAVDFLELFRREACLLQMGGSDQWGNIVNGVEITRRMAEAEVFGLTTPLITTSSGAKMGKTAQGAMWLNADMLSPYDYWQFWRNTEDADVGRFLRLFTDLPLTEVARLEALQGAEINEAKKVLADEATRLLHGEPARAAAADAARAAFEEGRLSADLPTFELPRAELEAGLALAALAARAGLAASNSEARRLAQGGGLRLNDKAEADGSRQVTDADLNTDSVIKLAAGKKKIVLVKPV
jgi:tyrosyl-tRNA synthetase